MHLRVSKDEFESIVMSLSSYNKTKDMNERLQNLFTIVDERNSEKDYTGVLQYKERLAAFGTKNRFTKLCLTMNIFLLE